MSIKTIVFIESPSEKEQGAIYHGINSYAAQWLFQAENNL